MRALGGALLAALAIAATAQPAAAAGKDDTRALERYAKGTWASFVAMTDERSGLPTDLLEDDGTRSVQTSTTNVGAYMWSAVAAERLGIIGRRELERRMRTTLTTLEGLERHAPSGQFYNWYDHRTGEKITVWPPSGEPHEPRLSSVDNGWLAVGLKIVADRVPPLARRADAIYESMDFGFYYVPERNQIMFHFVPDTGEVVCCYDTIVSESRIASYIGIAKGELPPEHYFGAFRAFPATGCDSAWTETRPVGSFRTYYGRTTYNGGLPYNGTLVTPSWGGSMFEALMPALFLPEDDWGPGSWGANHPLTVDAQIHHGLTEAGYGYWGFSPANVPEGGYTEYGVDGIGSFADGYASNRPATLIDRGYEGCREGVKDPPPSAYANGVVTPHAAFLGLRHRPHEARANLRALERDFPGLSTPLGFKDSVNVDTGAVSSSYLSLDQGMIMAALGNALGRDVLRDAFAGREIERGLRPVIGVEEFGASPRPCTIRGTEGDDRLRGTRRDDVICGLGGDDAIDGRDGADAVFGDAGDDRVAGGGGDDTLYGGEGADRLDAGGGRDVASGGPGADAFRGGRNDHYEPGD